MSRHAATLARVGVATVFGRSFLVTKSALASLAPFEVLFPRLAPAAAIMAECRATRPAANRSFRGTSHIEEEAMKLGVFPSHLVLLVIATLLAAGVPALAEEAEDAAERAAIEAAARDYIDGWYDGDAERMARGLHPDLRKRSFQALPGGDSVIRDLTYSTMVAYTRAGFGTRSKREGQVNRVTILDVSPTTASVKTVSPEFIDYLHLAKVDGRWRIVNVLWEPTAEALAAHRKAQE